MTDQRPPNTDFDSMLEFYLNEIQAERLTRSECLRRYPELATQLAPLLHAAESVVRVPKASMRSEARDALEQRLRERMKSLSAQRRTTRDIGRFRLSLMRWVSVAVTLAVIFGLVGASTVAAAAGSLPGDFLYPVKRWSESVSVNVASDDVVRAGLHLDWAQRRLNEFEILSARGRVDHLLLIEVEAEVQAALVANDVLPESQRVRAFSRIVTFNTSALEVVASVRESAPPAAADGLAAAMSALMEARDAAFQQLPTIEPSPTSTLTHEPPDEGATSTPEPSPTLTPPGRGTPAGGPPDNAPGQEGNPPGDSGDNGNAGGNGNSDGNGNHGGDNDGGNDGGNGGGNGDDNGGGNSGGSSGGNGKKP